jgi:predicted CXXCH cytochrome family protein
VTEGQAPEFPFTNLNELPEGYTWEDISYVVGGYHWKALFVDQEGYVITDAPGSTGNAEYANQYNFANDLLNKNTAWVPYHAGEADKVFDCSECHTTGYSPNGNQNDLPGLVGTWTQDGVRCERCHGPGSLHITNPQGITMQVDRDSAQCAECHILSSLSKLEAEDGFIIHTQQAAESFQSKHYVLDCVDCHNPHTGVVALRQADDPVSETKCENCHFEQAKYQNNAIHMQANFTCQECHMPRITVSAWSDAEKFSGDMRSHLMGIDPTQIGQVTEDGSESLSQVGINFACRHCHGAGLGLPRTDDELIQAALGYHERPEITPEPTPEE